MVLQESDMFMDALTASTKSKEPRKRKRRTSISKDGPSDSKKSDLTNADGGHDSPSHPSSPQSADDRSPLVVKPNFKVILFFIFYRPKHFMTVEISAWGRISWSPKLHQ